MNLSAPLGALCAALIGAVATLLGLLVSKENKTSEFRQEWINKLRDEITKLLVSFNEIRDATHIKYSNIDKKVSTLGPLYAKFNEAIFNISLRVNQDEAEGQDVLQAIKNIHALSVDEETLIGGDLRKLEEDLLIKSKILLKKEWERVKYGEPVFRGVRRTALIATPILLIFVVIGVVMASLALTGDSGMQKAPQNQLRPVQGLATPPQAIPIPQDRAVDSEKKRSGTSKHHSK